MKNMFPKDFYDYLISNTLVEIKGGITRPTFLSIWIVEVDRRARVFARSWNKSSRSWFTEFLNEGIGEIRYGEKVIRVKGHKVDAAHEMNHKVIEAYIQKYNQPRNLKYSEGFHNPNILIIRWNFFMQILLNCTVRHEEAYKQRISAHQVLCPDYIIRTVRTRHNGKT